jgi:4-hydroxy-tetrahydrodipicolinate reductase
MIRVIQVGLGPIGQKVTRQLMDSKQLEIVAALDIDEGKHGQDVGVLAGSEPAGIQISRNTALLDASFGDVAVITTSSDLERVHSQILDAVTNGLHVVSTCEELSYPWIVAPEISKSIDEAAKKHNVSVLGTGINPGFLMDFLPLAFSGLCFGVRKVRVERVQNAAFRRLPFQQKIGAGLTPDEFQRRVQAKTLRHVGLTESMHMIADTLGWKLEKTEDIVKPVIATEPLTTDAMSIETGQATGVNQIGRGYQDGEEIISLIFRATVGEPASYDRIILEGSPNIDTKVDGGINGDIGTVAVTINAIPAIVAANPGLRTMADMPVITCLNS